MKANCSCMVLNYNDSNTTIAFVNRIKNYNCFDYIVVVDNCSTDDSYLKLLNLSDERIHVIKTEKNGGYGYGNNFGAKYICSQLNCKYILLSNPDVIFEEAAVWEMLRVMSSNDDVGIVTAVQHDINDDVIPDVAWKIPTAFEYAVMGSKLGSRFLKEEDCKRYLMSNPCEVECVPGACLLINSFVFQTLGGYDEGIFLFCEETVLAIKMKRAGYRSLLLVNTFYKHEHSTSINKSIESIKRQKAILFNSREYVMKKYMRATPFHMLLAKILHNHILKKLT